MTVKGEEDGEYNWCDIVRRPEQKSLFFRSFPFWSSVSIFSLVEQWTVSPWIRYVKCSCILAYFSSSSFLKYFPCFLSHKLHLNLFGNDIYFIDLLSLHTTYIHYLCVAQFPSDCKRKKEENKMSKKVSACKGRGNLRTFQDFYSRLKEVSIWKCYWSIVRWILRNKAAFKQKAQENV